MNQELPQFPYKGLSYYEAEDKPIFAARDDDIIQCGHILGNPETRILILHGRTGCGKSSFLRAGLIPFLEMPEHSFQFLKDTPEVDKERSTSLFIRSTAEPLERLADTIYSEVNTSKYTVQTPDGRTVGIDFSQVLEGTDRDSFLQLAGRDPQRMVEVLSTLASLLPGTLTVVIDQAEEVLTVRQDEEGRKMRDRFMDFMALFSLSKVDLKLLIAIRSEWYAEFINAMRKRPWEPTNIRDYMLGELTEEKIELAIKYPTTFPSYGFSFENGLPERIARDLKTSPLRGGVLPVMQLICKRLYHQSKESQSKERRIAETSVITHRQYMELGGVEGQLDQYFRETMMEFFRGHNLPMNLYRLELEKWGRILDSLVRKQIDGTVTTDLRSREELLEKWKEVGSRVDFDKVANYLTNENIRILQRTEIFNPQIKDTVIAYSLGHDAIGLALKSLLESTDVTGSLYKRLKRLYRVGGISMTVLGGLVGGMITILYGSPSTIWSIVAWTLAGYGILFIVLSYLPRRVTQVFFGRMLERLQKW